MKTKIIICIRLLIITVAISILFVGCNEDELIIAPITFNPAITYGSMTDQDGNTYKTVTIGTQIWMAENLKTTKYRNGDPVQKVTDKDQWGGLTTGAYCYYENNTRYINIYGFLYNWYAVDDNRNLAPVGWHVATDTDWSTLNSFLGSNDIAGKKLKETGRTHWLDSSGTNENGFTALPGGYRDNQVFGRATQAYYSNLGSDSFYWTSTEESLDYGRINNISVISQSNASKKSCGFSVRCIKD